tara:strand:- start:557 stop:8902 length:8346 start_codon:yes stop_codon:yes gene_type:complete
MAKQDVNIGVEGNDGTGDSIRESFRKVNENFTELYAVFGVGGQINFTTLSDTPDTLTPNTIALVNDAGTQVQLAELASNSALGLGASDTITFSYSVPGKLIISSAFTEVADDSDPTLNGPLYASGFGIAGVGISEEAANAVNTRHFSDGVSGITVDDLVITKGYADQRYITSGLPLRIADEPTGKLHYTFTINSYVNNDIEITSHYNSAQVLQTGGHGLDSGSNGTPFVFTAEDTDPTGLVSGTTYYIRVTSPTRLSLFTEANKAFASGDSESAADDNKILVSGTIAADDSHTITDAALNNNLSGNFLEEVGLPRKSIVRRQGDTMTGELYLSDHPGELAGQGAPNGPEDLQAATKFYVDNTAYSSPEVLFVSTKGDDTMAGVPPGREGTSNVYAFNTINAAAQRADILVRSAASEPGNYMQTLTHTNFQKDSSVMFADVDAPQFEQARYLIDQNRQFVQKEVINYINFAFPNFSYNQEICERDTGLILDAIALDINRGLNANYLTRQAGERYFASVSGRIAVTTQLTETKAGVARARDIVESALANDLLNQKNIINNGITRANPGVVTTSTDHGLANKNIVLFKNIGGMTQIEGQKLYVKVTGNTTFELFTDSQLTAPYDTSGFNAHTSGGIIGLRYQIDEDQFFDDGQKIISSITLNNPIRVVTTTDHNLVNSDVVQFASVGGTVELNGQSYFAQRINATTIDLYSDSGLTSTVDGTSGFSAYTSGGTITSDADASSSAINAVKAKFNLVNTIIENGIDSGSTIVYGSTYKIVVTNGAASYTDQTNPTNTDALPGKVIRGKRSEAIGQIVSFTNNVTAEAGTDLDTNALEPNPTVFQVHLLSAKDFEPGEPLEFGNFVKKKQVTIRIESGIYEEDFPIKLSNNVSLKGDEFRRVIIKPKTETQSRIPRVSQSKWAQQYFYRDNEFDGIDLGSEGTTFLNQEGTPQGKFGYHYLFRGDRPINVKPALYNGNVGDFDTASSIVKRNKDYIIEETIQFITQRFPALVYSEAKCRRDTALIIDALVKDLKVGGEENILEIQGSYHTLITDGTGDYLTQLGDSTQETATEAAINNIASLTGSLLVGSAPTYTDGSYTAGSASVTAVETPDITLGSGESGSVAVTGELIDIVTFVFDVEYNPPKRNDQMDLFLMSDATIVRNVTCQGHGGFMCVLDPEGQVLTKSPYIQTASSFSKSKNKKTFAGGMYVDAYVGNLPSRILSKTNAFQLNVQSNPGEGLRLRPPQLPCPFYVEGRRYQVNAISDYDQGQGTATIYLDANSNDGTGYDETQFASSVVARDIFFQTAGNRSLLANDFTQVNDLGYGLVANNAAFSEQVSTFTYYCQTAMYANNGSEIRALNCSNGYGNFGLIAEGADPNEIPDQVTLKSDMVQPAKAYVDGTFTNSFDDASITVYDLARPPTSSSLITIDHGGAVGTLNYAVSAVQDLSDQDGDGVAGESGDVVVTGLATLNTGSISITTTGSQTGTYTNVPHYLTSGTGSGATVNVTIDHAGSPNTAVVTVNKIGTGYAVGETIEIAGTEIGGTSPANDLTINVATIFGTNAGTVSNRVYKLDLKADDVSAEDFFGTLQAGVNLDTIIEYRDNFSHVFDGVNSPAELVTRPSTAINFDESDTTTYRSIAFSNTDSFSQALAADEILTTFEAGYDFVDMAVSTTKLSGGYGSAQGDTRIAITPLLEGAPGTPQEEYADATRITKDTRTNGNALEPGDGGYVSGMRFLWDGKTHAVTDYYTVSIVNTTGSISVVKDETITQAVSGAIGKVSKTTTGTTIELYDITGTFDTTNTLSGSTSGALGSNSVPTSISNNAWAFVSFADVAGTNINSSYSGSGINSAIPAQTRTLTAGGHASSTAEITIAISLLRATGHDFTQIGTGSFNDSNYPNVILGDPVNSLADFYTDSDTATSSQVWERRKGRVFFVSTDQDGFFRVGKFFSVDQATGDITFAGEIGLSNANALGFKKGVTINEFSADDSFADESGQAVPTEKATGSFINRVLGYNVKTLAQILGSSNRIGPGFLPLNGDSPMEGNINMGSNTIQNLALPASGTDAVNKNYVDDNANSFANFAQMRDTVVNSPGANEIVVATGAKIILTNPESGGIFSVGETLTGGGSGATGTIITIETISDEQFGTIRKIVYTPLSGNFDDTDRGGGSAITNGTALSDIIFTPLQAGVGGPFDEFSHASESTASDINIAVNRTASGTEIDLQIEALSIENADVSNTAAIAQSKLAMNTAGTRANSTGIAQSDLGVATFKDTEFTETNGFVELQTSSSTSTGVAPSKLQHIATDTVLGRSAAGNGAVSAIGFNTILDEGGALRDGEFPAYVSGTDVLVRTAAGTYTVKDLSTGSTGDTVVLRKSASAGVQAGAIQAEAFIIGGDATYEILSASGTTLSIKTPGQATILSAVGTDSNTLNVDVHGLINVGKSYVDPSAASPVLVTSESTAQTNTGTPASGGRAGKGFLASNWVYTKGVEALDEGANGGSNSTGIVFGANVGFAEGGANTIVAFTNGSASARINTSGLQVDSITSLTTDTDLTLSGNGTGIVTISDSLDVNSIESSSTDTNLTLSANGTGVVNVNDTLSVSGTSNLNGSVNLGDDAAADTVTFTSRIDSNIEPDSTANNRNLGASARKWNTVYATTFEGTATSAQYADLAENYLADAEYEEGTVLVFGGDEEVSVTNTKGNTRVAGVVSTNPAHLMNSNLEGEHVSAIALQGRVPCKVLGQVSKGDMLVTSAIPGYAIVNNSPGVGQVIGKAVGAKDDDGKGTVEVVVGRV